MRRSDEKARRRAHAFIYAHSRRNEFLAFFDEHEDAVDDLKLFVERYVSEPHEQVRATLLIRLLREDFAEVVRTEWAGLLANLLVWEFPELRPHLRRDLQWDATPARSNATTREGS